MTNSFGICGLLAYKTLVPRIPVRFLQIICVFCVLVAMTTPARAAWWWPFGGNGIDYAVTIDGADNELNDWFKKLKLTDKTEKNPPQDLKDLDQELLTLENRLRQALAAKGYYEPDVRAALDSAAKPPILHYTIAPGKRSFIDGVRVDQKNGVLGAPNLGALDVQAGDPADADAINGDAARLLTDIGKNACLLSLSVTPVLQLKPDANANLVYRIDHGARADFGLVIIKGNDAVKDFVIRRNLAYEQGDCFEKDKLTQKQNNLFKSQLFSSVAVTAADTPDANGEVPITVNVAERVPRTARIGANYATDVGAGLTFGWEHRNFFGGAEKVNADAVLAQQEQSLKLTERVPWFRRDDQALTLTGGIKREDTDAYDALGFNLGAAVERKISDHWTAGVGAAYDLKQTDDERSGKESFSLVSVPLFAQYDSRDDTQDAKRGIFARGSVTPYQDTFDPGLQFIRTQVTGQTYLTNEKVKFKPTLALRANVGSIVGSSFRDLPSDLRFYAGGGGSVRGYSYQSLAPRFNGDPIGGGSLIELTTEARLRFTEEIGGVAFIDAGNAYSSSVPSFNDKLYYGAGVGVRYYSAIGPIRADIAVPLNGKEIGEDGIAFYVSLGQAF